MSVVSLNTALRSSSEVGVNFVFSVCPEQCQFPHWLNELLGSGEFSGISSAND